MVQRQLEKPQDPSPAEVVSHRSLNLNIPRLSRLWPLTALLLGIGIIALTAFFRFTGTADRTARAIADAFRAKVSNTISTNSSIGSISQERKLVVATVDVTVDIKRESKKSYLSDWVKLGDSIVRLRVSGNKAQYYVPLDKVGQDDFKFDTSGKQLTITLPSPVLDTEFVDVQSDPTLMEVERTIGWGRLDSRSGDYLEEQARMELRERVIEEANKEIALIAVREKARPVLDEFFGAFVSEFNSDIDFKIQFNDSVN